MTGDDLYFVTGTDGEPEGVVDLALLREAGARLACRSALNGENEDAVYADIHRTVDEHGPTADAVLVAAVAHLAVLLNSTISLVESSGWPMGDHLRSIAAGRPIDYERSKGPSRAERRRKGRRK